MYAARRKKLYYIRVFPTYADCNCHNYAVAVPQSEHLDNCNTCFMFAFWGSMWVWVALPAYNGFLAPDDVRQRVVLNRWVV